MRQILIFIILVGVSCLQADDLDNIFINEFMASNIHVELAPDTKDFEDWIELYNLGDIPVHLGGLYLTDDLNIPSKWRIPDGIIIEPKSFVVFWADGKDIEMHTNFKLNDQGDELAIFRPDGIAVDWISYDNQIQDVSFGRYPDGNAVWYYFANPTLNSANDSSRVRQPIQASEPAFSLPGGLYSQSQSINLSALPGATIRFTTDGSIPTQLSQGYSNAITVDKTTVIRARTFYEDLLPSPTVTQTYIIDRFSTLPVISIACDPKYLYDDSVGITTGLCLSEPPGTDPPFDMTANYWQDWERPVSLEYYEPDGKLGFKLDTGVKIFGGAFGRQICQKAFSIFAREKYGFKSINYRIFPSKTIDQFKRIILRASSNDYNRTFFRDAMMNTLLIDQMDIDYQAYQPAIAFINAQFQGIYNIREKMNKYYPESNYGIDADNVDLLENIDEVNAGDNTEYQELIAFVESNDMSVSANYEHVKNLVDVDELMNYYIAQLYFRNHDWLVRNTKYWRRRNPPSKWRWMLFDLDWGFGGEVNQGDEQFKTNSLQWALDSDAAVLFERLLENTDFRNEFVQRFASHLNITFNPERVINIIDRMMATIAPEMPAHIEKWSWPSDMPAWEHEINLLREFAELRPHYVREHLETTLHLNGTANLTIHIANPELGTVSVNTVKIPHSGSSGLYYRDIPIYLKAIPLPGNIFARWEGISNTVSNSINILLSSDESEIVAVFEPDHIPDIVINEIHYNPSSELQGKDENYEFIELLNPADIEIDISGYSFTNGIDYTFPPGTVISAGEYIIVTSNLTTYQGRGFQAFQFSDSALSNSGERISLYDKNAKLIDSVVFNDKAPWPNLPDGEGPSLELIQPFLDNSIAASWKASRQIGGTPGQLNTIDDTP